MVAPTTPDRGRPERATAGQQPGMRAAIPGAPACDIAKTPRRVPELASAAPVPGDDGDDLWPLADADPVAAVRALIPIVGEVLRAHLGLIADFHILPSGEQPPSAPLPTDARRLVLRRAEAEDV